jgi:FtsP/CotA-like multicopper oxidase with cupredoxin domain
MDQMTSKPFEGETKIWTERGKDRLGTIYRKAVYREYTNETFTTEKRRAKEWEHLGIMGPLMRAEVGDTIVIQLRNNTTQPYSIHPHGVSYSRDSEGTPYADTSMDGAGLVSPGQTHTYIWNVPERAGPGESDGSSVVWLYHSHNWEPKDVNAGLVGPMAITRRGMARPDGSPKDLDREFATLFMLIDENQSHYLQHNIDAYAQDPKSVNKLEFIPSDVDGNFSGAAHGFVAANFKAAINGYMFSNMPMPSMEAWRARALVRHDPRWRSQLAYTALTRKRGLDCRTPHGHFSLLPAQFITADMVPDNIGMWMFHCHVDEHMEAGMTAMYQVTP